MKRMFFFAVLFSCLLPLSASKAAMFPQLIDPRYLIVDNGQLIISDYPYIYLYALEDFSLKKKIGGPGEGPGEFYIPKENMNLKERGLVISVSPDCIAAGSSGRISFFKRNGRFRNMTKLSRSNINAKFYYFNGKLLGLAPRKGKLTVSLWDSNLENEKKVLECKYWFDWSSKKMENFFDRASDTLLIAAQDNKIFLTRGDSPTMAIDGYSLDGEKCFTIKHDVKRTKIPNAFRQRIETYFRVKFRTKNSDYFIKNLNLPEYFPAVRSFCAADQTLYVVTFNEINGKTEILLFDMKGTFLRKIWVPVKERNPEQLFPFSVSKDKFYQIVENEENENWELFVSSLNNR